MGATESSQIGCTSCGAKLPPGSPRYDLIKACEHTKKLKTHCYWIDNDEDLTINKFILVSVDGAGTKSTEGDAVSVKKGAKLFKYFRVGATEYYCSGCYVWRDTLRAANVLLELAAKGTVISKDMEVIKLGKV